MKKYNYLNNLEKSFRKQWQIGIDQDRSFLNVFINALYYVFYKNKRSPYLFVRLSVRGKLIFLLFSFIAFILIPLGFILVLFVALFIGFKLFG